jgi:hypothetical protein
MNKIEESCKRNHPKAFIGNNPKADGKSQTYVIMEITKPGFARPLATGSSAAKAWKALKAKDEAHAKSLKTPVKPPKKTVVNKLKNILNSFDNHTCIDYVREDLIIFKWSEKGRGFGEYAFLKGKDGKWSIDNECDGRECIKKVICRLIDRLPLRDKIQGDPNSGKVSK